MTEECRRRHFCVCDMMLLTFDVLLSFHEWQSYCKKCCVRRTKEWNWTRRRKTIDTHLGMKTQPPERRPDQQYLY
jgi:hypothetical protein